MTNFAAEYEHMSDDEVLRIAGDRKDLLDDARTALESELRRRGLTAANISEYKADVERAEIRQEISDLPFLFRGGIGKRLFGKREHVVSPGGKTEEFDTTLWIVIFWLPVIPLCTLRVRRRINKWTDVNPYVAYRFTALHQKSLDWHMIFITWGWCVLTIGIVMSLLHLLHC